MSTRLLTMKFMQRAAAASNNSTPESTPDRRDAKRQRMSNGSYNSSPVENSDARAVRKALAAEEQKRQQAVDREAARRGETKWYLDVQPSSRPEKQKFTVVSAGYASLDNDDTLPAWSDVEDEDGGDVDVAFHGRRSFGIKEQEPDHDDQSVTDASHDEESPGARPKGETNPPKSKKRKAERDFHADEERGGKDVNLKRLKSISSTNPQNTSPHGKSHGRKSDSRNSLHLK